MAAPPDPVEYNAAIERARTGDHAPALDMLRARASADPQDVRAAKDRVTIASWAGLDAEVISSYLALPQEAQSGLDMIEAAARAYRNEKQFSAALSLFQKGLRIAPGHLAFLIGETMVLADLSKPASIAKGELLVRDVPLNADVHAALGYAYSRIGRNFDALRSYNRALELAPARADLRRERIFAYGRVGLAAPALALSDAEPGLLDPAQQRKVQAAAAAELVRLAPRPSRNESERFLVADRAISRLDSLIALWREQGQGAEESIQQARLDRIVAYHARFRMQDASAEYQALRAEGVTVPPYVLAEVASAYLYLRKPVIARDLYRDLIDAGDPDLTQRAEIGLFYALVENEEIEAARAHIEAVNQARPIWHYEKGQPEKLPNSDRLESEMAAAMAGLFADDLPEAERRFSSMTDAAPANVGLRTGRASVWRVRGLPRTAEADLKIAETQAPRALDVEVEQGLTALDLNEWRQAELLSRDMLTRFPENLRARRLDRLWQVHNKAEFQLRTEYGFGGGNPLTGNRDRGIEAVLYSPPLDYNWRVFAGSGHASGRFEEGKGKRDKVFAGVEYRTRNLVLEAEASGHRYGHGSKPGMRLAASVDINDNWQIGATGEVLSSDTPLRALHNGIKADGISAFLRWRENERREVRGSAQTLWFSDGNDRVAALVEATQRIHTQPHFRVDLGFDLSFSANSRSNVPYFSPSAEAAAMPHLTLTHIIHRRYETVWDHALTLGAGGYWQKQYGTGAILSADYRHTVRANDVFEASAGVATLYRPYDGDYEPDLRASVNFTFRF